MRIVGGIEQEITAWEIYSRARTIVCSGREWLRAIAVYNEDGGASKVVSELPQEPLGVEQ